jgi:hypothetical protein
MNTTSAHLLVYLILAFPSLSTAADLYLSYGSKLIEEAQTPFLIEIWPDQKTVTLRLFMDPGDVPTMKYMTWQASGSLGALVDSGDIQVPGKEGIMREIELPIPFAGSERPLRFRVVLERGEVPPVGRRTLATLDVHRIGANDLGETKRIIRDAGITLEVKGKAIKDILDRHEIAYTTWTPDKSAKANSTLAVFDMSEKAADEVLPKIPEEGSAIFYFGREGRSVVEIAERTLTPGDILSAPGSDASSEMALLRMIKTRILLMQNRKNLP